MARRKSLKQIKKLHDKECFFCGEKEYDLLDGHRIIEGQDGGTYNWWNILTLCSNCHRRVHAGIIKILGKYKCMGGNKLSVIHYIENGEEKFK
jgi:5-methylcytosine-specific restriction endonuclease McrA